jgi:hypothetical protein
MSPERISGREYGLDSDLWSVALCLQEISTGVNPYSCAQAPLEIVQSVIEILEPLASVKGVLTALFVAALERMMQRTPSDRISVQEVMSSGLFASLQIRNLEAAQHCLKTWCLAGVAALTKATLLNEDVSMVDDSSSLLPPEGTNANSNPPHQTPVVPELQLAIPDFTAPGSGGSNGNANANASRAQMAPPGYFSTGKKFRAPAANPSPRRAVQRDESSFKKNRPLRSTDDLPVFGKKRARLPDEAVAAIRESVHGISGSLQSKLQAFDAGNVGSISRHEFEQAMGEMELSSPAEKNAMSRIFNSSEWETINYKDLKMFVGNNRASDTTGGTVAAPRDNGNGRSNGSFGKTSGGVRSSTQSSFNQKYPNGALKLPPMKTGAANERLYGNMAVNYGDMSMRPSSQLRSKQLRGNRALSNVEMKTKRWDFMVPNLPPPQITNQLAYTLYSHPLPQPPPPPLSLPRCVLVWKLPKAKEMARNSKARATRTKCQIANKKVTRRQYRYHQQQRASIYESNRPSYSFLCTGRAQVPVLYYRPPLLYII